MTDSTVDGIDLTALQNAEATDAATITSLSTQLTALAANPNTSAAVAAEIAAIQTTLATLQTQEAADEALIAQLSAKLAALPTTSGSPTLTQAQIIAAIIAALGGSGGGSTTGAGGTGTTTAPAFPISYFINGKIQGLPFVTDASGILYQFATDASGNFFTDAPGTAGAGKGVPGSSGKGAQFSFNGILCIPPNYPVALAIDNGLFKAQNDDGNWWTPERPGDPNAGATLCAPPNFTVSPTGTVTNTPPPVASTVDPTPVSPAPGSSGKIIAVALGAGALAAAIATASAGDTIQVAPGVYNESVAIGVPLLVTGGGKVVNPGTAGATYTAGAILDATGVTSLAQGQGGFVPLTDSILTGWEVRGFGAASTSNDGTGGYRNNGPGVFHLEDFYLTGNQMGVGPHGGDATLVTLKNGLAIDNGLPKTAPGYAHNFYFEGTEVIVQGGLTSILHAGGGGGHAFKSRALKNSFLGLNYLYASEESCLDISDGTATPFLITADATGGTTIEKKAGDVNTVIWGYGTESQNNGNAGGTFSGKTIIIPNDGRSYIIQTSGPITYDSACKFLYTDGTPVKAGGIITQAGFGGVAGTVTGLP